RIAELESGVMTRRTGGLLDAAQSVIEEEQAAELATLVANRQLRRRVRGLFEVRRPVEVVRHTQINHMLIERLEALLPTATRAAAASDQERCSDTPPTHALRHLGLPPVWACPTHRYSWQSILLMQSSQVGNRSLCVASPSVSAFASGTAGGPPLRNCRIAG